MDRFEDFSQYVDGRATSLSDSGSPVVSLIIHVTTSSGRVHYPTPRLWRVGC